MATTLRGSCLCGACSFSATVEKMESGVCHCGMCRKWSGGMFICAEATSLVFDDGAPVNVFKSSDWGERLSCATCGASLAWRAVGGDMTVVSVQAFDKPEDFPLTTELCIDRKPGAYALTGETAKITEAELFAMFAPEAAQTEG